MNKPGRTAAHPSTKRAPQEVRIIGGQWKRSRLPVPDLPGLRPTPDRVRETLFNWLGQDLSGWRCLDAFAGSGALGFEAASRGAAEVVLLEKDRAVAQALRASVQRLGAVTMRIEQADALQWMRGAPRGHFDLVLLDPPFAAQLHEDALQAALPLLAPRGHLYLEAAEPWDERLAGAAGLQLLRQSRAGAVHFHLLRRQEGDGGATTLVAGIHTQQGASE